MKHVLPRLLRPHKPGLCSLCDWRLENDDWRVFGWWCEWAAARLADCCVLIGEGAMMRGGGTGILLFVVEVELIVEVVDVAAVAAGRVSVFGSDFKNVDLIVL